MTGAATTANAQAAAYRWNGRAPMPVRTGFADARGGPVRFVPSDQRQASVLAPPCHASATAHLSAAATHPAPVCSLSASTELICDQCLLMCLVSPPPHAANDASCGQSRAKSSAASPRPHATVHALLCLRGSANSSKIAMPNPRCLSPSPTHPCL